MTATTVVIVVIVIVKLFNGCCKQPTTHGKYTAPAHRSWFKGGVEAKLPARGSSNRRLRCHLYTPFKEEKSIPWQSIANSELK
jgi:hypothetical protein